MPFYHVSNAFMYSVLDTYPSTGCYFMFLVLDNYPATRCYFMYPVLESINICIR